MEPRDGNLSRRDVLRHWARGGVLACLAAVAAVLLGRRGTISRDAHTCINRGLCRGCTVFDSCRLPTAQMARQSRREV